MMGAGEDQKKDLEKRKNGGLEEECDPIIRTVCFQSQAVRGV